jgi:hypothetical protein
MREIRLAMWSGPRNISTAMMRSFENRSDCVVSDEPLYAAYLKQTGLDHPGAEEIMTEGECDLRKVADSLVGQIPQGKLLWYQKHMSHHLLPGMDHDWIYQLNNIFLIREPHAVVASYIKSRAEITSDDIGILQQGELFDELCQIGQQPMVIDSSDFLNAPRAYLQAICSRFNIPFEESMLSWPKGARDSDGIWAKHWYHAVWNSTGFEKRSEKIPHLSIENKQIAEACMPAYKKLHTVRLISA